jgi:hypothetical protein
MTDLKTLTDDYIETRLIYDEAHETSSRADKVHKAAKARLVEGMIEQSKVHDPPEVELKFMLRNQFGISCNKDNEVEVKEWLHERYGDLEEFTEQKLVKKTIEERLKEEIEGEQLDQFEVPEFMNLKTRPDVSCTGWRSFSAARRA